MRKARSLVKIFSVIADPRKQNHSQNKHQLIDILVMAICGVVGGANNWVEIALFCRHHSKWFKEILGPHLEVPSHDTFWRVFGLLDSSQFEELFREWVKEVFTRLPNDVVNIDGKCLAGTVQSYPKKNDAIRIVNAWASESGLVLGQNKAHVKGLYERDQMVELVKLLHLKGCIVTMDAMGTCQESCSEILSKEGHYTLAVKKNQRSTYENIVKQMKLKKKRAAAFESFEKSKARQEKRAYLLLPAPEDLRAKWPGLKSIGAVTVSRTAADPGRNGKARLKTIAETRYYISSMSARHIKKFAHAVRSHWSIENKLHWGLDVAFGEDGCRSIIKNGAENFAILRRIAFNLTNQEKTFKASKRQKRLRAGWDISYLEQIVFG